MNFVPASSSHVQTDKQRVRTSSNTIEIRLEQIVHTSSNQFVRVALECSDVLLT